MSKPSLSGSVIHAHEWFKNDALVRSVVEEVTTGRAGFGLVIDFPVHVFKDGLGLRIRAGFGKLGRFFGFVPGFVFDALVTDIEMPGMNGYVLAQRLRDELMQMAWDSRSQWVYELEPLAASVARAKTLTELPVMLLDHSERLYERVRHLDRRMYLEAGVDEAPNPVQSQFDRLRNAFGS